MDIECLGFKWKSLDCNFMFRLLHALLKGFSVGTEYHDSVLGIDFGLFCVCAKQRNLFYSNPRDLGWVSKV